MGLQHQTKEESSSREPKNGGFIAIFNGAPPPARAIITLALAVLAGSLVFMTVQGIGSAVVVSDMKDPLPTSSAEVDNTDGGGGGGDKGGVEYIWTRSPAAQAGIMANTTTAPSNYPSFQPAAEVIEQQQQQPQPTSTKMPSKSPTITGQGGNMNDFNMTMTKTMSPSQQPSAAATTAIPRNDSSAAPSVVVSSITTTIAPTQHSITNSPSMKLLSSEAPSIAASYVPSSVPSLVPTITPSTTPSASSNNLSSMPSMMPSSSQTPYNQHHQSSSIPSTVPSAGDDDASDDSPAPTQVPSSGAPTWARHTSSAPTFTRVSSSSNSVAPSNSATSKNTSTEMPTVKSISFYAITDTPKTQIEATLLQRRFDLMNENEVDGNSTSTVVDPADFVIHVGNMINPFDDSCPESAYVNSSDVLLSSPVPLFAVPGEVDWYDCVDPVASLELWRKHFVGFEENWSQQDFHTGRQAIRPENFKFMRDGILFIGVHVLKAKGGDKEEMRKHNQNNVDWVIQNIELHGEEAVALVIFGNGKPGKNTEMFFRPVGNALEDFQKPILYLHGDAKNNDDFKIKAGIKWGPKNNAASVRLPIGGIDTPPLLITVSPENVDGPFIFDSYA